MLRHPEFSIAEWEQAPQYWGPGIREMQDQGNVSVLDFDALQMIASAQQEDGAFRADGFDTKKAPLKLGNLPAAFLQIVSEEPGDFVVHAPHGPEILVVLNGILTVKSTKNLNLNKQDFVSSGPFSSGDVLPLNNNALHMSAHSLSRKATSLALTLYDAETEQENLLIIRKGRYGDKMITPTERTKLPYERGDNE